MAGSFQRAISTTPLTTALPDGVVPVEAPLPDGVVAAEHGALPEGVVPVDSSTNMVTPAGHVVGVDPSQVTDALRRGYRHAEAADLLKHQRQEQYGGVGQGLAAAAEGAAGALTFGLSPKIETATGLTTQEAMRARKEEHPFLHGVGTVAGVAIPLALTGGAAAPAEGAAVAGEGTLAGARAVAGLTAPALIARAGRAAQAATEGLGLPGIAGRVLPAAAAAALEGGLYGGEDVVERHFIGDPSLTAEKAMLEVGLSALIPGVLAGGGKLVGEALAPLGEKLIAKGAAAAQQKAVLEEAQLAAKEAGSLGGTAADAFRKYKDLRDILIDPTSSPTKVAAARAFLESEEGAALREASQGATLDRAPELAAEYAGKKAALEESAAGRPERITARTEELQDPAHLGNMVNERLIQRYGSRAVLGSLMGHLVGAPGGVGALGGISYGYMKDVIKRIVKDPAMYSTVGRVLKSPLETLSAMMGLGKYANATDDAIASGVAGIFGGGTKSATAKAIEAVTPKSFSDVSASLNNYNSNPDKLAEEVGNQAGPLQTHAPATTAGIHALASRVVQHLGQNLPQGGQRQLLDPEFHPSPTQLAELNQRMDVAQRGPAALLHHVANGTLTSAHLTASQAMYPSLHQETLAKVGEALAEHMAEKKPIPTKIRTGLSRLLGSPLDRAHTGMSIAATQMLYAVQPAQPGPGNAPKNAKSGVETHFGSRLSTDTQGVSSRMGSTA